jgi:hypothetical protein
MCVIATQAAEFCSIDVYPTDNLAVFIYREGDIVRLRDAQLTFTETQEGVFVNDELAMKRRPKGYTLEEVSIYSKHKPVAEAVAKGADPQVAVAEYLEQERRVRLALTTAFVENIETLSVIEIIPLLEAMLDELDPERMYYSRILPDPRSDQRLFLSSPTDALMAANLGAESVPSISIDKMSDTVDMSKAPTRPFMNCGDLTRAIEQSARAGSRIYCIIVGSGFMINFYPDEAAMLREIECLRTAYQERQRQ